MSDETRGAAPAAPGHLTAGGAAWVLAHESGSQRAYVNLGPGRFWYALHAPATGEMAAITILHFDHARGADADEETYTETFEGTEAVRLDAALRRLCGLTD
jgi:hypothetical protein